MVVGESKVNGKREMDYRPFWLSLQFMAFIVHVIFPRKDSEVFFFSPDYADVIHLWDPIPRCKTSELWVGLQCLKWKVKDQGSFGPLSLIDELRTHPSGFRQAHFREIKNISLYHSQDESLQWLNKYNIRSHYGSSAWLNMKQIKNMITSLVEYTMFSFLILYIVT